MILTQFIEYISAVRKYSPHTVKSYQTDLDQFAVFCQEEFQQTIETADHIMIRSWLVFLFEKGIKSRTANRKISSLRSFFKYLKQNKIREDNPFLKIVLPKQEKRLASFVEEDKMDLLLDKVFQENTFRERRDKLIIHLFYSTGIRQAELISLSLSGVDMHQMQLKVLGKRNKERIIPLSREILPDINQYLASREALPCESKESTFFIKENGKKLYPKLVYRVVNYYLSQVTTIKKKSPHVLRHSFATHMLNNGADLNSIKEILGHVNLSATQIYTHNTIKKLNTIYKNAHPRGE